MIFDYKILCFGRGFFVRKGTGMIMEWLLRIFFCGIQISGFVLTACGLAKLLAWNRRKLRIALAVIILVLEVASAAYLADNPVVSVPQEYEAYVTEADREAIAGYNRGLYSANIPVFPVCVQVTYADETQIRTVTQYLFFGSVGMCITQDGPSIEMPIFPGA